MNLRTVRLGKVVEELLGCAGKIELLCSALIILPNLDDFFNAGLLDAFLKGHEHRRGVTVGNGHAQTLRGDGDVVGEDDLVSLDVTPDLERLLLGLFLLAADIRNEVIDHFRPCLEGLAGAGNRLIGAGEHLVYAECLQGMNGGNIALQRAVGFDCHKASLGAQTLSLRLNHLDVVRVDFGNDHGNVRSKTVSRIVGNDGAFRLGVTLLESADFVLLHIDGAEAEVNLGGDLLHVVGVENNHILVLFGESGGHVPSAVHNLSVGFAGTSGACRQCCYLKPRMIFEQERKALTHHTGSSDDSDFILSHC